MDLLRDHLDQDVEVDGGHGHPPRLVSVTMVYPPPRRLIYQGNSPTLSPG